jgi:hypothetical protein
MKESIARFAALRQWDRVYGKDRYPPEIIQQAIWLYHRFIGGTRHHGLQSQDYQLLSLDAFTLEPMVATKAKQTRNSSFSRWVSRGQASTS